MIKTLILLLANDKKAAGPEPGRLLFSKRRRSASVKLNIAHYSGLPTCLFSDISRSWTP
jgi:hypothetical protein